MDITVYISSYSLLFKSKFVPLLNKYLSAKIDTVLQRIVITA